MQKAKTNSVVAKPKAEPKPKSQSKAAANNAANNQKKRDLVAADIGHEGEGCLVHDGDGDTRKRAWLDDVQSAVFFALARADATAHIALIKVNFCTNDNFHKEFPAVAAVVHTGVRMSFILAFNSKVVFSGNEHTKWSSLRPVVQKLVLDAAIAHLQSKTVNVVGSSDKLPLEPGHLRSIVNSIDSTDVPLTTPSTKRIDPLSELKACDDSALAMVATWADSVHSRQPRLHKEFQNMIESFPDALRSANVSSNHDFVTVCRNVIDSALAPNIWRILYLTRECITTCGKKSVSPVFDKLKISDEHALFSQTALLLGFRAEYYIGLTKLMAEDDVRELLPSTSAVDPTRCTEQIAMIKRSVWPALSKLDSNTVTEAARDKLWCSMFTVATAEWVQSSADEADARLTLQRSSQQADQCHQNAEVAQDGTDDDGAEDTPNQSRMDLVYTPVPGIAQHVVQLQLIRAALEREIWAIYDKSIPSWAPFVHVMSGVNPSAKPKVEFGPVDPAQQIKIPFAGRVQMTVPTKDAFVVMVLGKGHQMVCFALTPGVHSTLASECFVPAWAAASKKAGKLSNPDCQFTLEHDEYKLNDEFTFTLPSIVWNGLIQFQRELTRPDNTDTLKQYTTQSLGHAPAQKKARLEKKATAATTPVSTARHLLK